MADRKATIQNTQASSPTGFKLPAINNKSEQIQGQIHDSEVQIRNLQSKSEPQSVAVTSINVYGDGEIDSDAYGRSSSTALTSRSHHNIALEPLVTKGIDEKQVVNKYAALPIIKRKPTLVIAIEIGNTYTSYAYSTQRNPTDITVNKSWGSEQAIMTYKNRTVLMTYENGKFHSFGYEAMKQLCVDDEESASESNGCPNESNASNLNYFDDFMQSPGQNEEPDNVTIKGTYGASLKFTDALAMILSFMSDHALEAIEKSSATNVDKGDIKWMVSINDRDSRTIRQCLQKAATQSFAVPGGNLNFELLTKAAGSLWYIGKTQSKLLQHVKNNNIGNFIIAALGGNLTEITICRRSSNNSNMFSIAEKASIKIGGNKINQKLKELLCTITSREFITFLCDKHPSQWINISFDFEKAKRKLHPESTKPLQINVNYSLPITYKSFTGKSFNTIFSEPKTQVSFNRNNSNICIGKQLVDAYISRICQKIVKRIKYMLDNHCGGRTDSIFITGGFGESAYVQEYIKQEFKSLKFCKVVTLAEASLCSLRGAVIMGHR